MNATKAKQSWYREPWPWMLMIFPLTAVIGGMVTLWLAIKTEDGVVADDYYKQGLAINRVIARDSEARALSLRADVAATGNEMNLTLSGLLKKYPENLRLLILHPTQAGHDQAVTLQYQGNGRYAGKYHGLSTGKWDLILEDMAKTWRLEGKWNSKGAQTVLETTR
jgi:hypothetical protein